MTSVEHYKPLTNRVTWNIAISRNQSVRKQVFHAHSSCIIRRSSITLKTKKIHLLHTVLSDWWNEKKKSPLPNLTALATASFRVYSQTERTDIYGLMIGVFSLWSYNKSVLSNSEDLKRRKRRERWYKHFCVNAAKFHVQFVETPHWRFEMGFKSTGIRYTEVYQQSIAIAGYQREFKKKKTFSKRPVHRGLENYSVKATAIFS